ncbi:MAG: DMT family transporter [Rhizobiales bacterium]|nr:DMT family transporter [Hyphomicrobiales bacterium]
MAATDHIPSAAPSNNWLANQPYLLLSLTALFWAGNAVIGRAVAGHIPPVTLAFIRWGGAFLIVLPFSWRYLVQDWPVIRRHFGIMVLISIAGIGAFNTLQYLALERTGALNILLLQSAGPLFVAIWSLALLGIPLTLKQGIGLCVSLFGVLAILLKGDLSALAAIRFNDGDLLFILALAIFGFYSVMALKRPAIDGMSFLAFTFGCGAIVQIPLVVWEMKVRPMMQIDLPNLLALAYVMVFPSTLAYLFFNRGVQLIGANRAAPIFHLIPAFGSIMAIVFLGEQLHMFHLVGYALVLTGVVIAARAPKAPVAEGEQAAPPS